MRRFVPRAHAGKTLLNVGCGWKMDPGWTNVDFSPYARLAKAPRLARLLASVGLLSPLRQERLARVDPEIICWDLRKGIPFDEATFDGVYHSHLLEHIDRDAAPAFLAECRRVLKPGGVLRVVVPDWETLTREYLAALADWDAGSPRASERHATAMNELIDQMVRTKASGAPAGTLRGRIEQLLRGDAAQTGELHRWMYDRRSLTALLASIGFDDIRQESWDTSRIAGWSEYGLDTDDAGGEYKPGSLYLEGVTARG